MTTRYRTPASRAFALAMLLIVYTFNFLDRQLLGILAPPIKAELGLSDTQLGMLGGLAFAILYSTLAVPFAWIADRTSRTWVITGSLAVWSGFTALCGMVGSFGPLFLCRVGVGIGEAGGVAPSYALISDIYPSHQRARALSVYSLGIPLGAALGALFGGYIAATINWRSAFLLLGLAGLLFAPVFALFVHEPERPAGARQQGLGLDVFRMLAAKPGFWLMAFGAASASMLGYGMAFWLPSLMRRSFGMDLIGISRFYGLLLLGGGVPGVLLGGWLADRAGRSGKAGYARVPALAFLAAAPLFAAGLLSSSSGVALLLFLLPQGLAYMWLGPVLTAVQHLVPAGRRATASASFLLINNLIGLGLGSMTIGAMSDALTPRFSEEALRVALLGSLSFYVLAGCLMLLAAPRLARDWVD